MKLKFDYLKKCTLLLVSLLAMSSFAFAQRTITGMVKDADGKESLIGASVLAEGTTTGTVTDYDGKFSLNVPAGVKALIFSYTGYNTQRVELGASNNVEVSLKGGTVLDQVVVVGYGSLKSKQVTSAVTSVKAEDFNKGNINDPVQLLQGKVAGLSIARPSGDPNGSFEIRLRGISTIGANVQPLVVVDGIPGVDLKLVDPNDIEQIDVLKDGSASAIYGARASSGVIIVTTKKGVAGRTDVDYSTLFAKDNIIRTPQVMSADDYLAAGGTNLNNRTDWYKQITNSGAFSQIHNLSLSGGVGKTSYRAAFNYRGAKGIMLNDGFDQLNGRFNLTQKALNDKLTFTLDVAATNRNSKFGFAEAFRYATTYNPTAPIFDTTSTGVKFGGFAQIQGQFDGFNPYAITQQSTNEGSQKRINLNGRLSYELMKGLTVSSTYGLNRRSDIYGQYYSRFAQFKGGAGGAEKGLASRFSEDEVSNFFNTTAEYKKDFGKLGFNVLGGYEYQDQLLENFAINGAKGFATDALKYNNIESAENILKGLVKPESAKNGRTLASFFGRVALDYDDTYFAQIALRRDGSSMLAEGNKWGLFPAVSAGVSISKLAGLTSFQNLKIRAGYGVTGALPGEPYLSLTNYRPVPVSSGTAGNVVIGSSFVPVRNGNPDLKWEQKAEINVGIDFLTLNSRLSGSLEYYSRNITDLLYYFANTPAGLFERDGITANAGELTSSGFEASFNYQVFKSSDKKGLSWNTGLNLGTAKTVLNKIANDKFSIGAAGYLKLANVGAPGLNDDFITLVTEGQQLGRLMAFDYAGVDKDGNPLGRALNGETKLLKDLTDADRIEAGNGLPRLTVGFSNQFQLGGFDLNFFFRAVTGHSLVNEYRVFYENNNAGSVKDYNRIKTKYWDKNIKQASYNSYYVEKADFVKLDNFTLGYVFTLPAGSSISKLRLYVSGNNLLTFTNYTGVDPEVRYSDVGASDNGGTAPRQFNPDPLVSGVDRRTNYFATRSFSVGLNVGF